MTTTVLAYIRSPSQGVWHLGPFPIRAYALFIIIGIVVALVVGDRRWEARGGERGVIYDISLWAVPFGLIGGRVYHVITDWPKYFGDGGAGFVGALRIWDGGLGIWGAVALGGVGAWLGCRSRGIPLPAFGDAIAPGIVLAQAIGRLGNYFNQELYGGPTTLPWGLEIYERRNASGAVSPDLANGVSTGQLDSIVHPTFLYELLWNVLVFAALIWIDHRFKIGHGRLFALYVAGYCLGRFWIELLRSDEATLIADIRVNSFTSTFVFIGAVVYIMVAPKGREDPVTLRGTPGEEKSPVDEVAEELVAVAATTGVVAAAKVAGDEEDEDARAAVAESEPEDDSSAESEEPEAASEAAAEAQALAEDVAEAPSEDIAEAEEFAAAGEEAEDAETESADTEAADELQAADEPSAEEAEEVAVGEPESDEPVAEPPEPDESEPEGESGELDTEESVEEPETEDAEQTVDEVAEPGPVAEVLESDEPVAAESEPDEPALEAEDADEALDEVAEPGPVAEEVETPEQAAPVTEGAEEAEEAAAAEPQADADPEAAKVGELADEPAGRFRRWLRGRRDG